MTVSLDSHSNSSVDSSVPAGQVDSIGKFFSFYKLLYIYHIASSRDTSTRHLGGLKSIPWQLEISQSAHGVTGLVTELGVGYVRPMLSLVLWQS